MLISSLAPMLDVSPIIDLNLRNLLSFKNLIRPLIIMSLLNVYSILITLCSTLFLHRQNV